MCNKRKGVPYIIFKGGVCKYNKQKGVFYYLKVVFAINEQLADKGSIHGWRKGIFHSKLKGKVPDKRKIVLYLI